MSWITRNLNCPPVLIVGPNRSGTSALLRVLSHHPLIFARRSGEAPVLGPIGKMAHELELTKYAHYYSAESNLSAKAVRNRLAHFAKDWIFAPVNWQNRVRQLAFTSKMRRAHYWAAKCFLHEDSLAGLRELFPGAKFLFIFRNGAHVVASRNRYAGFRDQGFERNVREWVDQINAYAFAFNAPDTLVLRHEEMVSSPEEFLSSIFDFVGLPECPECLETLSVDLVQPEGEAGVLKKTSDLKSYYARRKDPTDSWTSEQINLFEKHASSAMGLLGYPMPKIKN